MASAGPRYLTSAGTVSYSGYNDDNWSYPGEITADDGSASSPAGSAYVHLLKSEYSYLLYATRFDFSLPDDAAITGIKVEVEARGAGWEIAYVALRNAGSVWGTANFPATLLTSSYTVYSYGGESDTWGVANPTVADINSSGFGVSLGVRAGNSAPTVYVDFVRVTVYYTEAAGGVPKHSDHYMRRRAA